MMLHTHDNNNDENNIYSESKSKIAPYIDVLPYIPIYITARLDIRRRESRKIPYNKLLHLVKYISEI